MGCELPCVVSNIPGNNEWIKNYENGLLFLKRNHEDLAQKIVMLLSDPELRKRLGKKAKDTIRGKADWDRNAVELYAAFERIYAKFNKDCSSEELWS